MTSAYETPMHGNSEGEAKWREPKSCFGQVLNFQLNYFVIGLTAWHKQACPHLELKTKPRVFPDSLSYGNKCLEKL